MSSVDSTTVKYIPANAPRNTAHADQRLGQHERPVADVDVGQHVDVVQARPRRDRVGGDGEHPEHHEEHHQGDHDERDLQRLAEDHDQADVQPLAHRQRVGRRLADRQLDVDGRRVGERRGDVVPAVELVLLADVAGHAGQDERRAEPEEDEDHRDVRQPVERPRHLPHLGVDEQERGEQQEQRERPRDERAEAGELAAATAGAPADHRAEPVRRPEVDQRQDGDAEQQRLERVEELAEREDRDGRADEEEDQFAGVDLLRTGERRPVAEPVRHRPGGDEHGHDEQRGEHVLLPASSAARSRALKPSSR